MIMIKKNILFNYFMRILRWKPGAIWSAVESSVTCCENYAVQLGGSVLIFFSPPYWRKKRKIKCEK